MLHSLRRIEGQLQGIERMVEEGRSCDDVLRQIAAVHAAVGRVGKDVLLGEMGCHLQKEQMSPQDLERLEKLFVTYTGLK